MNEDFEVADWELSIFSNSLNPARYRGFYITD